MLGDYSKLVTLYKLSEVYFRLFGTNGFRAKAKNERFSAAGSRCHQNFKFENVTSRRRLADYVKKLHQKACCTCSTIILPHSTNQIIDFWCCRCRCRRQILNSLVTAKRFQGLSKTLSCSSRTVKSPELISTTAIGGKKLSSVKDIASTETLD